MGVYGIGIHTQMKEARVDNHFIIYSAGQKRSGKH
jgi:hypothetical protein